MNEFTKLAAAMKRWGWGRTSFLLALFLLAKQFVTFDQALILILLAAFLDTVVRREPLSSRHRSFGTSVALKNYRRRS
jgi:hypothetical protein